MENSWARIFADDIFPYIDEKRFSVLYSDNGSPNTPVNVIVGALIIKELFDYSDDEMVENLMLDLHLQYALHTTSFPEQTVVEGGGRRLRAKKNGGLDSRVLQNPSDPEATFREKDGKEYRGYVANMEETEPGKNPARHERRCLQGLCQVAERGRDRSLELEEELPSEKVAPRDATW